MAQSRVIPSGANQGRASSSVCKDPRKSEKSINQGNAMLQFIYMAAETLARSMRKTARTFRSGWSRHTPHQGEREKARRRSQIERGILQVTKRV